MDSRTDSPPVGPPPFHSAVDLLDHRAATAPDARPYRVVDTPSASFAEWADRSDRIARGLLAAGVQRQQRVGLLFRHPDWDGYAAAYFGVLRVAAVGVHLSADLDPEELPRRIGAGGATVLVLGHDVDVPAGFHGRVHRIDDVEAAGTGRTGPGGRVAVPVGPLDLADVLFTSGTTGPAKAFANPHGNLSFGQGPAQVGNFSSGAPMLAPMPLGTPSSAGIVGMFALTAQAPIVLCPTHDLETMGRLVETHRIGTVMLVPWIAMQFVIDRLAERYDLGSVTSIAIASGALPSAYVRRLLQVMPDASVMTAYAQGEAVPAVMLSMYDLELPLAVGRPSAVTEMRLVRPDGTEPPPGEVGEVWLRAPAPKRLYLDERLNREVHVDGWTRTRDLARLAPDGRLVLVDRMSDVVHTAHGPVSSLEVEEVLYRHPDVAQVAVCAHAPGVSPARVRAYVVPARPGVAERDLLEFAAGELPPHAVPDGIRFRASLPRGLTGKVRKAALVAERAPGLATAGSAGDASGRPR